jgi:acyl dehydratase
VTAPNEQPSGPHPSEPEAEPAPEPESPSDSRTRIIRRAPTGPIPTTPDTPTTNFASQPPPYRAGRTGYAGVPALEPSDRTAVAACAVSIVSGWATSVVATDLIAGWWRSDRLFCIAVAFLALVFAGTTVSGVILLLQRRSISRYLLMAGALVAVLTYIGVFIAGARVAWVVHLLPVLPIATVVLVLLPQTKRWLDAA